MAPREFGQARQQPGAVLDPVDLVEHQHHRQSGGGAGRKRRVVLGRPARGLDHQRDHVGVAERATRGAVEVPVDRAPGGLVQARRVDEHQLPAGDGMHAEDAMARGLRLRRDDADLVADQRVDQRGLAHVGAPDDRHQTAAERRRARPGGVHAAPVLSWSAMRASASCAACVSAARRLAPSPSAITSSAATRQRTKKVLSCSSPAVPDNS